MFNYFRHFESPLLLDFQFSQRHKANKFALLIENIPSNLTFCSLLNENVPVIFNNENAKMHYLSEISKKKRRYF